MTLPKALEAIRAAMPTMPGDYSQCTVQVPWSAAKAVLTEAPLSPTPLADVEVAAVLDFGAAKHAGTARSHWHHLGKACKHGIAYLLGQRIDPETGLRTLAHVAARALLACDLDLRAS